MFRLVLIDETELLEAVEKLKQLGAGARRVLATCIENQGVIRKSLSASALALDSAGFIRIRDLHDSYELLPTLAGEEASEYLDENGST